VFSQNFKRPVPKLRDVPGRSDIELHIANHPEEIRGCFAVGTYRGVDYVADSEKAFHSLMDKLLATAEAITFTTEPAQEAAI